MHNDMVEPLLNRETPVGFIDSAAHAPRDIDEKIKREEAGGIVEDGRTAERRNLPPTEEVEQKAERHDQKNRLQQIDNGLHGSLTAVFLLATQKCAQDLDVAAKRGNYGHRL